MTSPDRPRPSSPPPPVRRVLETALYVEDLQRARTFYRQVVGLSEIFASERLVSFDAGGGTVLLLFLRGAATGGASDGDRVIPPHDGSGALHFALAVDAGQIEAWRRHLEREGVTIEAETRWARGGTSLYFRDPDGHLAELATPGVWSVW